MKRILVTGSSGFIGHHLMRRLQTLPGVEAVGFSRSYGEEREFEEYIGDLTDPGSVEAILHVFQPHIIYHLAGIPIVREDAENPTAITETNVLGTHNLLAYSPPNTTFVLASSATIYGDGPWGKHGATESDDARPTSIYGATKVAAESLVQAYSNLGKVCGVSLRLVANVGGGATHGVLRDLIRKAQSNSETLDLLGDEPGSTKPYCHVSDTVEAFILAGFERWGNQGYPAINVAPTGELSVKQLARIVLEELGIKKPLRWLGSEANWAGDNPRVRVDAGTARSLGWSPWYGSEEAVRQAIRETVA